MLIEELGRLTDGIVVFFKRRMRLFRRKNLNKFPTRLFKIHELYVQFYSWLQWYLPDGTKSFFVKYNEYTLIDNDTLLSIVIILTHALKRSIISSWLYLFFSYIVGFRFPEENDKNGQRHFYIQLYTQRYILFLFISTIILQFLQLLHK